MKKSTKAEGRKLPRDLGDMKQKETEVVLEKELIWGDFLPQNMFNKTFESSYRCEYKSQFFMHYGRIVIALSSLLSCIQIHTILASSPQKNN